MPNDTPTVFTDDKLKKLKNDLQKHIVIDLIQDDGLRLLERLEAAERVCKEMRNTYVPDAFTASFVAAREAVPAWLKAAGK